MTNGSRERSTAAGSFAPVGVSGTPVSGAPDAARLSAATMTIAARRKSLGRTRLSCILVEAPKGRRRWARLRHASRDGQGDSEGVRDGLSNAPSTRAALEEGPLAAL